MANELAHPNEKHAVFDAAPRAIDRLMNLCVCRFDLVAPSRTLFAPTARLLAVMRGM